MINETFYNFLVQHEEQSDGGLVSLLAIIKYYKGNTSSINLNDLIQTNYPLTSMSLLVETVSRYGILSVVCDDVDIPTIINYNQPVIINTTTINNKPHFVVCFPYNEEKGFLIWDSRNGSYYTSIDELKSLRTDKKCMAFCFN
jgi:ATP-binding cassette subfamily B protein